MKENKYPMLLPLNIQTFAENKVRYGVKNVHFAPITETGGDITFGTPIKFPGAVSLTLEPLGETTPFYADDSAYYVSVSNNGYEGTYEVAEIPLEFRTKILGDDLSEDGILTETTTSKPKQFAMMFEFDGDVKATRHVLYNCTASRPSQGSETKGESIEPGTSELSFTASPNAEGIVKRSTTATTTDEIYNAWYTKVFEPTVVPTP